MTSPLFSFITRALHSAPMLQFIILFASLCAIVDAPGGPLGIICEIVPRTLIHFPFCGEALEAQGAVCYCFAIQRSRSACLWQPIGLRQRARGGARASYLEAYYFEAYYFEAYYFEAWAILCSRWPVS